MTEDKILWANKAIYQEIFRDIIRRIRDEATQEVTLRNFKEALTKQDSADFEDILVEAQLAPLYYLMLYLDGAIGPSRWPGVQLVNAQTFEPLSNDFGMELAGVIRETLYLD